VALFKQAVDERDAVHARWQPARVSFGNHWVHEGALELFTETVALHPPLLPVVGDEASLACVEDGGVPALDELRLHQGTIWRWNRPVYDPAEGGHLRVEMRALPAGPAPVDMAANMAVLLGLVHALREETDWMTPALPFHHAEHNFYRAAQSGLDAMLLWPAPDPPSPRPVRAGELVRALLPRAREGLAAAGVEDAEADALCAVLHERASTGQTGARWQCRALEALEAKRPRGEALAEMLRRYLELAASGEPVARWPVTP